MYMWKLSFKKSLMKGKAFWKDVKNILISQKFQRRMKFRQICDIDEYLKTVFKKTIHFDKMKEILRTF